MQLQYHGQRRGICGSTGSDECPPSLSWDFPTIALLSIVSPSFKHGILLYGSIGSLWIAYGSPCCPAWRQIVCSFHFACDSASQAEHPFHRWETIFWPYQKHTVLLSTENWAAPSSLRSSALVKVSDVLLSPPSVRNHTHTRSKAILHSCSSCLWVV